MLIPLILNGSSKCCGGRITVNRKRTDLLMFNEGSFYFFDVLVST